MSDALHHEKCTIIADQNQILNELMRYCQRHVDYEVRFGELILLLSEIRIRNFDFIYQMRISDFFEHMQFDQIARNLYLM